MNVASPRVLVISLAVGIGLSIVFGSLFSWLGERIWTYAVGTMLFIFGIVSLCMGLLGAVEPPEGWATRKKGDGRRSFASQLAGQQPPEAETSPYALAIWGIFVGGPMILLALLAFSLAA